MTGISGKGLSVYLQKPCSLSNGDHSNNIKQHAHHNPKEPNQIWMILARNVYVHTEQTAHQIL